MGYHRAGFKVVGVDHKPQPHFPFEFHQGDALEWPLEGFDVVHASPPCQAYVNLAAKDGRHPALIEPTRSRLDSSGSLYVIENVVGAPLHNPAKLCGSMFSLGVRRHRLFESNVLLFAPECNHKAQDEIRAYYGAPGMEVWTYGRAQVQKTGRKALIRGSIEQGAEDMGINWMTWDELREAIPPAYTEYIGRQLMRILKQCPQPQSD